MIYLESSENINAYNPDTQETSNVGQDIFTSLYCQAFHFPSLLFPSFS